MLIHIHFLWNHVDILLAAVILVIIIKTVVVAAVVKGFGYNNKTALLVRLYQIAFPSLICFTLGIGHIPCPALTNLSSVGGNVSGTDWGICFCPSQSCF